MATFYIDLLMMSCRCCCYRLMVSITIRITSIDDVVVVGRRLLLLNSRIGRGFGSRAHHVVLIAACADGDGSVIDAVGVEKSRLRCRLQLDLLRCHRRSGCGCNALWLCHDAALHRLSGRRWRLEMDLCLL